MKISELLEKQQKELMKALENARGERDITKGQENYRAAKAYQSYFFLEKLIFTLEKGIQLFKQMEN